MRSVFGRLRERSACVVHALRATCAVLLAFAASSAPAGPDVTNASGPLEIEVRDFPARVVYGEPFEFELVRACDAPLEFEAFDEARLAPLLVRTLSVETARSGERVIETRRLRARALALGDPPLPAFVSRARFGGREESARLEWPPLLVESSLAADDDGRAEQPLELLGPARSMVPLVVALAAVAAVATFVVARRRRTSVTATVVATPAAPANADDLFDVWLANLRDAAGRSDRELYTAIVAVLRRAAGVRSARDLSSATARELVRLIADERIAGPCARSERVCFARLPIERDERARDLDATLRFVEDARERRRADVLASQEAAR
jgi:hypothetical protein